MPKVTDSNEIKNISNFLFFDDKGEPKAASIGLTIWIERTTPELKAQEGFQLDIRPQLGSTVFPFNFSNALGAGKVDVDMFVLVNKQLQQIEVKDLPLNPPNSPNPTRLIHLFEIAAKQAPNAKETQSVDKESGNTKVGFVKYKQKNQKEAGIYKVTQMGAMFQVHLKTDAGWAAKNTNAPKIRGIINKFKKGDYKESL